jgi:PPM family protein phosphatase
MHQKGDADTLNDLLTVTGPGAKRPRPWSSLVGVEIGALSHPGKVRPNNEDHYLTVCFGRSLVPLQTNLPEGQIPERFAEVGYGLVVADGMGGAAAGEVASSLAITFGLNLTLNSPKWNLVMTPEEIRENMETWRERFHQIDAFLRERARADPALSGMGTTLTLACSVGDHLLLYHIGDSRAYLFRRGRLLRLTRDHTVAQTLVEVGGLKPEEVASHFSRHILTRALGAGGGPVEAESQYLRLADGDRLLLCTDGLTEMVADARIADTLARVEGSEEASRALVEQALAAGGKDNVTVVLARYAIPATAGLASSTEKG